jgi:tRNA modification GTPase
MSQHNDTIFALSSGRPPAAIAVVRVSGPRARDALAALVGRVPEARRASFARARDPQSGEVIDEGLVLWFPAPRTETGEDMVEFQMHGSRAVVSALFAVLARLPGFRPAQPGEFTRRAFEHGRMDLTRVEGLADLIFADTQAQRRQAMRQLQGLLGDRVEGWRQRLVEALARVEAQIDFPDEGDVPHDLLGPALASVRALSEEIRAVLSDERRGERVREGLVVAIAGPPNAGKSSLLNRVARRSAAIVSPFAGTTRDVIEVHLDLAGYPVTLLDTAGLRPSEDPVEQEGIRRARERAVAADLVLWVVEPGELGEEVTAKVNKEFPATKTWIIRNKSDLLSGAEEEKPNSCAAAYRSFLISAMTGSGIEGLVTALADHARVFLGSTEPALVTRERQRRHLEETVASLSRVLGEEAAGREDLVAEELRLAARSLGRLTGRVDVEDVLDVVFRDFCIGK